MKLFSRNVEILAPCHDVIIKKFSQKELNLYIIYIELKNIKGRKNIKNRNYNDFGSTFFSLPKEFLWKDFKNL